MTLTYALPFGRVESLPTAVPVGSAVRMLMQVNCGFSTTSPLENAHETGILKGRTLFLCLYFQWRILKTVWTLQLETHCLLQKDIRIFWKVLFFSSNKRCSYFVHVIVILWLCCVKTRLHKTLNFSESLSFPCLRITYFFE